MNQINACFINYRHTEDPEAHKYVCAFVKVLKKHLAWELPGIPIFFDEEGSKVGDLFNEELAYQLCRSACMVMFFSRSHFDPLHPYCALEYKAMLKLEEQRLGPGMADLRNKGLILPVVFRGLECLPPEIKNHRHYESFDEIVVESDFKKKKCEAKIRKLAGEIRKRYIALYNAGALAQDDCGNFRFPDKNAIMSWLSQVNHLRMSRMPGH